MAEEPTSSTHPPLPPTKEDDRLEWLRLLRSRRVGISTFWRLLADHGSAKAALAALPGIARAAGVPDYHICPEGVVIAEMKAGRAAGARLVRKGDAAYPAALLDIPDAPPLLWVRGDAALLTRPMLALVGARNASSLGTRMTRALATDLAEAGFVIVSGLARGVDAAAHEAALAGGTIAVMAGGVDVIYPPDNAQLADRIAATGLLISEQPMGLQPQARHFPVRNRIISGLAQAVVVVEAAAKSGSLITARAALDQGREVFAVPGHPFDMRASGCNMLIRDGATLVRSAADVIEALGQPAPARAALAQAAAVQAAATTAHVALVGGWRVPNKHTTAPSAPQSGRRQTETRPDLRQTAALHRQILDRLGPSPMAEDQLIRDLNRPAATVTPAIVELELDGRIARAAGGMLALVN